MRIRIITLTSVLAALLTYSGHAASQSNAIWPDHALAVSCFPGTGTPATPPPSPYPARAYLPLLMRPGDGSCALSEQEPNDTHTAATPFAANCLTGRTASVSDLDWYRLDICSAVPVFNVQLNGPAGADLDLYLYGDPPGNPIKSSEGPGSQESFTASGLVTGTYYLLVSPVSGSGAYTVTGTLSAP